MLRTRFASITDIAPARTFTSGTGWSRTNTSLINKQPLSHLSYSPKCWSVAAPAAVAGPRLRRRARSALRASEVGDDRRRRRVKTDHVEHAGVVGISDAEPRRRHSDHDQLGRNAPCLTISPQSLRRVHGSGPGLVVGVDHERVYVDAVLLRPHHRQGAVGTTHRQLVDCTDDIVQPLTRRDR